MVTTSNVNISFSGTIATMYDEILGPAFFEPYAIETAGRVASLQPKSVLETACGTGRVTNHLRKNLPESTTLTAIDISPDMLDVAMKKLSSLKNITWQQADALNLPFANNTFDVVTCQFGAMFFADRQQGINESWRVLKPGGTFIFSVWDKLEYNPLTSASRQILKDFFGDNPPKTMNLAFSMSDKKIIEEILLKSGFQNILFEKINKQASVESAEALAISTVEGSIIRDFIAEKDPSAIPILKRKIEETAREKFGDHPVKGMMQAIFIKATKPL